MLLNTLVSIVLGTILGVGLALAARALDGADEDVADSSDVQLEALVTLLEDALEERVSSRAS